LDLVPDVEKLKNLWRVEQQGTNAVASIVENAKKETNKETRNKK